MAEAEVNGVITYTSLHVETIPGYEPGCKYRLWSV